MVDGAVKKRTIGFPLFNTLWQLQPLVGNKAPGGGKKSRQGKRQPLLITSEGKRAGRGHSRIGSPE